MLSSKPKKPTLKQVAAALQQAGSPARAKTSAWFFKTGPGQYGEGDRFIGITVPVQRQIAKKYQDIGWSDMAKLISSPIHEYRFTALEILVMKYASGDEKTKKQCVEFYLKHRAWVNNWDLVDTSAPYILGDWLFTKNKKILTTLSRSGNIWDRRIAIITTLGFISQGAYAETLRIAKLLLKDKHDLIHKAVGWMLREVGKRSLVTEEKFLQRYYKQMPRTMLRYAIERFAVTKRNAYLKGTL